jgi:hypothetical protein
MSKILYIATEYSEGVRPYALSILKFVWTSEPFVIVVIRNSNIMDDFAEFPPDRLLIILYPDSKIKRIHSRFYPRQLMRSINHLIKAEPLPMGIFPDCGCHSCHNSIFSRC